MSISHPVGSTPDYLRQSYKRIAQARMVEGHEDESPTGQDPRTCFTTAAPFGGMPRNQLQSY